MWSTCGSSTRWCGGRACGGGERPGRGAGRAGELVVVLAGVNDVGLGHVGRFGPAGRLGKIVVPPGGGGGRADHPVPCGQRHFSTETHRSTQSRQNDGGEGSVGTTHCCWFGIGSSAAGCLPTGPADFGRSNATLLPAPTVAAARSAAVAEDGRESHGELRLYVWSGGKRVRPVERRAESGGVWGGG